MSISPGEVPSTHDPARPARRRSAHPVVRVLLVMFVVVGALIIAFVIWSNMQARQADVDRREAPAAARAYVAALKAHDWQSAYDDLDKQNQQYTSPDKLSQQWLANEAMYGPLDHINISDNVGITFGGKSANIYGTYIFANGKIDGLKYMVKEGGRWKISVG